MQTVHEEYQLTLWYMLIDLIHLSTYQGDMGHALHVHVHHDHARNSSLWTEEETEAQGGQATCPGLTPAWRRIHTLVGLVPKYSIT